jgi:spermidine/putrescine transport system permease protein
MDDWKRNQGIFWPLLLPPAVWLLLFFLIPLGLIWVLSFGEKLDIQNIAITWTLENYAKAVEPLYASIMWKSLWVCGLATLLCLVIGYPVAFLIAFVRSPMWKALLLLAVIIPFAINILVRTFSLIAVLRPTGMVNAVYEALWTGAHGALSVVGLGDALLGERFMPVMLLYSNTAVIVGIVFVFFPFMVLPLYANIEKIDRAYLEASLDLGASHLRTFWSVILPQTWHGILSGLIIVFIPSLGYFFIPEILGGANSDLIGNVIERQFKAANDWPFGAALSFLLMYATFGALALRAVLASRRGGEA